MRSSLIMAFSLWKSSVLFNHFELLNEQICCFSELRVLKAKAFSYSYLCPGFAAGVGSNWLASGRCNCFGFGLCLFLTLIWNCEISFSESPTWEVFHTVYEYSYFSWLNLIPLLNFYSHHYCSALMIFYYTAPKPFPHISLNISYFSFLKLYRSNNNV